jgi:Asp/Glu/hydantoin racemase
VADRDLAVCTSTAQCSVTPSWGPESAEGWLDSFLSAAAVLDLLNGLDEPFDALVMAGFGEHGREGARELTEAAAPGTPARRCSCSAAPG